MTSVETEVKSVLISEEEIKEAIAKTGKEISEKYKGKKLLVVGILKGSFVFVADLVREIKKSSNTFIKENKFTKYRFQWQEGFGSFSYGRNQLSSVIKYIENQKEHHKKITFQEEYKQFLKEYNIDFKDEYLFDWIE
jgi:hypothetical protein